MDKEKVMAKISNLLNKTVENGCTEHEAISAATMAQKLIAEHHVDMREFEEPEEIDAEDAFCTAPWQNTLATVIATRTCCEVIFEHVSRRSRKRRLTFVGRETDRKAVVRMWDRLVAVCRNGILLEKRLHKERYGNTQGVENSYAQGFIRAVREAMDEQCKALMLIIPQEVEDKFEEMFPRQHTEKPRSYHIIGSCYRSGLTDGRSAVGKKLIANE